MAMAFCIVCGNQYELASGRSLTCSEECHERLINALTEKLGRFKKIRSMTTGKCYRVPTRTILEEGLTHHDLTKFPEWDEP